MHSEGHIYNVIHGLINSVASEINRLKIRDSLVWKAIIRLRVNDWIIYYSCAVIGQMHAVIVQLIIDADYYVLHNKHEMS